MTGYVAFVGGGLPTLSHHHATGLVRRVEERLRHGLRFARIVVVGYPDVRMVQAMEQVRTRCERAKVPLSLAVPTEMQADCAQAYGWKAPLWLVVDA